MKTLLEKDLNGKAKLSLSVNSDGDFVLAAVLESSVVLDALTKRTDNTVDDALAGLLKGYLQKLGSSSA